jgi:SAM-dependent methyltransferase
MSNLLNSHSLLHKHKKDARKLIWDLSKNIEASRDIIESQQPRWKNTELHDNVMDKLAELQRVSNEYNQAVSELTNQIDATIQKQERKILQKDYARYDNQDLDLLIERQSWISDQFDKEIIGIIQQNVSWQYPTLEVNPADARYSNIMNAADPQYAICATDQVKHILKAKFNDFYASRRLRIYDDLEKVPANQIGFATCINMFEYMPLDPIKDIVKQIFNCLRPGGKLLLTYNNCEHSGSLDLLDNNFRCLNNKDLMESLLFGQGFDIHSTNHTDGIWTWLLVSKPGKLSTQKLASGDVSIQKRVYPWNDIPVNVQNWILKHKADIPEIWFDQLANNWKELHEMEINALTEWQKYSYSIKIYIASTF